MIKRVALASAGLILLAVAAMGIALAWPMASPDSDPSMEILPPPDHAEARPHGGYMARDGTPLPLRVYEADQSGTALILLHGGGGYGAFLYRAASQLAQRAAATVYVPDLRGHGDSPGPRGDVADSAQLTHDVADLIAHVRHEGDWDRVILGGHSMGGGLSLRMAQSEEADGIDGYLLIAPFLGLDAPTMGDGTDGYAHPNVPRIIALSLLNTLGITAFDEREVIYLNAPADLRDGHGPETLTWRFVQGAVPADYRAALSAVEVPLLLVVGSEDEVLTAENFAPVIEEHAPHGQVVVIPGFNHVTDVLNRPAALDIYASWLDAL
jgi:non-heme chloroperoxidase